MIAILGAQLPSGWCPLQVGLYKKVILSQLASYREQASNTSSTVSSSAWLKVLPQRPSVTECDKDRQHISDKHFPPQVDFSQCFITLFW